MMRAIVAIFFGKCVLLTIRILFKTGGSAAPGLVALKIDPNLITKLSAKINTNIVITGTNGKTTTSAMVSQILVNSGKKIIHNNTGSNLSRGIASTLLASCTFWGTISTDVGIWEADEAAFVDIIERIKPKHIVVLNIARDQLDRYGEIDTIIKKWKRTLEKASWEKILYLNADDGNIYDLRNIKNTIVQTFGIEHSPVIFEKNSHKPSYSVKARILESSLNETEFVFASSLTTSGVVGQRMRLPMAGAYNIYNFLAAYLVSDNLGITTANVINAASSFKPAFGRMERVMFGKTECLISLIKNPAGATQVIRTITPLLNKNDHVVIMLNDNIADGTDVSWIWDTDFEKIAPQISQVYITGTRRYDMALRLYYAGVDKKSIYIEESIHKVLSANSPIIQNNSGRVFILPTYTSLLELQRYLKKKGYKEKHWHE